MNPNRRVNGEMECLGTVSDGKRQQRNANKPTSQLGQAGKVRHGLCQVELPAGETGTEPRKLGGTDGVWEPSSGRRFPLSPGRWPAWGTSRSDACSGPRVVPLVVTLRACPCRLKTRPGPVQSSLGRWLRVMQVLDARPGGCPCRVLLRGRAALGPLQMMLGGAAKAASHCTHILLASIKERGKYSPSRLTYHCMYCTISTDGNPERTDNKKHRPQAL